MPSDFQRSCAAVMKASSELVGARDASRAAACRGDGPGGRGHGHRQDKVIGLKIPQATKECSGGLVQECSVEDEERWTTEGYRQPAYEYGSNLRRLDESFQPRRERCGVMCDGVGAIRGNDVVLACGERHRTVVVRFARLIALLLLRQRGTVRVSGKLADASDDDENRREERQPRGHQSRASRGLHDGGVYRAAPPVSTNGAAG